MTQTLKILLILSTLSVACGEPFADPLPPRDQLHWPIGLQIHPNGEYLYVVNSNFDTRFREDLGGTVSVIDLSNFRILPDKGPYIPSFGGKIRLNGDVSKAYVTSRLDNQVVVLDVGARGGSISCNETGQTSSDSRPCSLKRVPNRSQGAEVRADPFGIDVYTSRYQQSLTIQALNGEYIIELLEPNGVSTEVGYLAENDNAATIADELAAQVELLNAYTATASGAQLVVTRTDDDPFRVVSTFVGDSPADVAPISVLNQNLDVVALSHLRGSNVTGITLMGQSLSQASMKYAELISGSNDVLRRPDTEDFYVAGRSSRNIAIFQPYIDQATGQVQAIIDRGRISLNHLTDVVDTRSLLFEPDGSVLYAVSRSPDAIHVVDLGPSDPETGTDPLNRAVRSTPLERRPSHIQRHVRVTDGRVLLYITCFEAQMIQVFDPALDAVIDEIELGARPYEFVNDTGGHCTPGSDRCLGYVTLFDDLPRAGGSCEDVRDKPCGSVGVIDLNPLSPRYHQLVAKIH